MSMLTGILKPTAGKAIFGYQNIYGNMEMMRLLLGICPQYDILLEFLSVKEHLELFDAFKGAQSHLIPLQVKRC